MCDGGKVGRKICHDELIIVVAEADAAMKSIDFGKRRKKVRKGMEKVVM